jgi:hypothetical protein
MKLSDNRENVGKLVKVEQTYFEAATISSSPSIDLAKELPPKHFFKKRLIHSPQKPPSKTPQVTIQPPQTHHDLPSKKHTKSPKPLKKYHLATPIFFPKPTPKN